MPMFMHLLVASVWTFLQGNTTLGGFFFGGIAGFILLWIFKKTLHCEDYVRRVLAALSFGFYFLGTVVKTNCKMVLLAISPGVGTLKGSFTRYDTSDLTTLELVILAYFINLTPGTTVADRNVEGCFILHTFPAVPEAELQEEIHTTLRQRILAFTR